MVVTKTNAYIILRLKKKKNTDYVPGITQVLGQKVFVKKKEKKQKEIFFFLKLFILLSV